MYCKRCGTLIENEKVCPNCGFVISDKTSQHKTPEKSQTDSSLVFWFLLGFLLPQVGLTLMFVWNDSKTKIAHTVGSAAGLSFLLKFIWNIVGLCVIL